MRRSACPLVLLGFLFTSPALALDVTAVGQTVPQHKTGVLQTDLTCAPPAVGVYLDNGATLDLNGHVLDGCAVAGSTGSPTQPQRMTVLGPGEIRNAGIYLLAGTLRVAGLTVSDAPQDGIHGGSDMQTRSTVRLKDVVVTGSGNFAIHATRVVAKGVTATGSGSVAIVGWNGVSARDATVSGNSSGIFAAAGHVRVTDSQVTGNQSIGVQGFRVSVLRSTVTGNTTVGPPTEADLISSYAPIVKSTTCGTSLKADATASWGVCAGD